MSLGDLFYKYFLLPAGSHTVGYNIVNTLGYVILALFLYFVVIRKIVFAFAKEVNFKFSLSVVLFVITGAMFRVMEEPYSTINVFARSSDPLSWGFYSVTPGIYLLFTAIVLLSFLVSFLIERLFKINRVNTLLTIGALFASITFLFMLINMSFPIAFFVICLSIIAIVLGIYYLLKKYNFNLSQMELFALFGQAVDGIATFTALTFFNFSEQHVASNILINGLGTWSFPVVKILLTLGIIWYLRKSDMDYNNKNYILLFIIIFGFATGIRDIFSIANNGL